MLIIGLATGAGSNKKSTDTSAGTAATALAPTSSFTNSFPSITTAEVTPSVTASAPAAAAGMTLAQWDDKWRIGVTISASQAGTVVDAIKSADSTRIENACTTLQDDYDQYLKPARDDFPQASNPKLYDTFDTGTVEAQESAAHCRSWLRKSTRLDDLAAASSKASASQKLLNTTLAGSGKVQ